jgi:hypothetical protein
LWVGGARMDRVGLEDARLGLEEKDKFPLFFEIIFGAIIIPVKTRKCLQGTKKYSENSKKF